MFTALTQAMQHRIGESDCEAIRAGLVAQPVNTLSSAAYTVAGLWVAGRAVRRRSAETTTHIVYGLALASIGLGSIAFHGPAPPGARLLHDLTIAAVFAVIAARNMGTWREWTEKTVLLAFGALIISVGGVMAVAPDAGNALTGLVGVLAVGTEILLYATGRRGPLSPEAGRAVAAMLVILAAAGLVNVLGRTDGPLCEADSLLQGHALWHVLTAAAFGLYARVTFAPGVAARRE